MKFGKRGQVTLFIILGVVIFASIFAFVFWIKPTMSSSKTTNLNFDSCVENVINEAIVNLAVTSGFTNPGVSVLYKNQEIPYLIYTEGNAEVGITQVPFPKQQFEDELNTYTFDSIQTCYKNSVKRLQESGYDIKSGDIESNVLILPEFVQVMIDAPTTIENQQFEQIIINVDSDIYGILEMAYKIMDESLDDSDYNPVDISYLMRLYPDYKISSVYNADSTQIYTIKDSTSTINYKFAIRSKVPETYKSISELYDE